MDNQQHQAPPPLPSGEAVDAGTSDPEILQDDARAQLARLEASVAQLQDEVLGRQEDPPDAGTEIEESGFDADVVPGMSALHPWRVITRAYPSDPTKSQWSMVTGADDSVNAGSIYNPYGKTYHDVASAWSAAFSPGAVVHGWLKVSVTVSSMTIASATVVTTDPSADADPYNNTTAVLVWELFTILADGTVEQYQLNDLTLEGFLFFEDDTAQIVAVQPTSDVGEDDHPARQDHQHKLDLFTSPGSPGAWSSIPTPADVMPSGATPDNKSAGTNAYPARADHIHDLDLTSSGFDGINASRTVTGPPTRPDATHLSFPQYALVFTKGLLTSVTNGSPVVLESLQC